MSRHHGGVLLILVSALGFGAMAIFAKLAYDHGAGAATLLTLRFLLAALVLWAIVAVRRRPRPDRRTVVAGAGLGLFGYSVQAGCYFAALHHLDASLTALLLYVYPALVFLGAVVLGRDHADRRRMIALLLATGGAVLVLAGSGTGDLDALGVALGLGAVFAYAIYILVVHSVTRGIEPFLLSALIATGAATTL